MKTGRVAELRQYVGFAEDDARLLARVHDALAPDFERVARVFYDKIREHEAAHAVFTGEQQIQRLQASLQVWMHRLFGGTYDDAYFERTARIGEVHVQVGLPQRYMFTAMAQLRLELVRLIDERAEDASATRAALNKALDLELAVMLESFRDAQEARRERLQAIERKELYDGYVGALELTSDLVIGLGDGAIVLFNSGAEATTGYGREEVIGAPFVGTLVAEESRTAVEKALADAPARGRVQLDAYITTRARHVRNVRWEVTYAEGGRIFLIGHDITEERALAERTHQTEKLAAIGTLAAGLAHEIRNPLNGALLHVSYLDRSLTKSGADPDLLEAVGVVRDEIKRLASLVTEFLDFARPKPLATKEVSLEILVARSLELVAPDALAGHVKVIRDFPTIPVVAEVDAAKIEQVILNLAGNAIEALAPTGGGHVTARIRRRPQDGVIEIEDDGPGMSSDAPIFDAFFSTKPQGTGLGLAIALRIVSDHGGTLDVESQPGHTVFRIVLPLKQKKHTS